MSGSVGGPVDGVDEKGTSGPPFCRLTWVRRMCREEQVSKGGLGAQRKAQLPAGCFKDDGATHVMFHGVKIKVARASQEAASVRGFLFLEFLVGRPAVPEC